MRLLPALLLFATVASAAETATLDHAKYTEALKAFRQGKASALPALTDPAMEIRRAAIDDLRERLVDEPTAPLAGQVGAALGKVDLATARLLLAALAEAKATTTAAQVATIAAQKPAFDRPRWAKGLAAPGRGRAGLSGNRWRQSGIDSGRTREGRSPEREHHRRAGEDLWARRDRRL